MHIKWYSNEKTSNNKNTILNTITSANRHSILDENKECHAVNGTNLQPREMRKETKEIALCYVDSISETILGVSIKLHVNKD